MRLKPATALHGGNRSESYDEPPDDITVWDLRPGPETALRITLATLCVLTLAAFANTVEDYVDRESIVRWDVEFSRWLHLHSSDALLGFFKIVTWAGNVAFLAAFVGVTAVWLARRRQWNEATLLAVSALVIELVNAGLKLLFHRPRPELAYVHLDTYSFPSGHAVGAAAVYGVFAFIAASRSSRGRQIAAAIAYVLLVGVVCFSRLYLEVHYLSDVLAGASLGAAWASGSLLVYRLKRDADVRRRLPTGFVRLVERRV